MKISITKYNLAFFALILTAMPLTMFSQTVTTTTKTTTKITTTNTNPTPTPTAKPAPPARKIPPAPPEPPEVYGERETNEKSLKVSPKVSVSLCVLQGNVKVNGWDRSEVRVFVKDGSRIGVKNMSPNPGIDPVLIMLLGFDPNVRGSRSSNECLYGEEIEIDVPRNASINIKGQETRTSIDSVRKAAVKNIGGDISLRNIAEGVEAATYEGDVSVENSSGAITLNSSNGNILAFEVSPGEIDDIFKAKTNNGKIVLQDLAYRQIEVNSISGSISFNGAFSNGGLYNFGTSNGSILLAIPQNTSCKVIATYGFGGFSSELPIEIVTENNLPRVQKVVGTMGNGDATLNLTTSSGIIRVKKKL